MKNPSTPHRLDIPFKELQQVLGLPPVTSYEGSVQYVSTDSRQLHQATTTLFVALKGPIRDGHDFIDAAYAQGVRQFLVQETPGLPADAGVYQVGSTVEALQQIAGYHRSLFNYPIVAITGSNGKTIVKEWLASAASASYNVVKSPKSYNSQIGVPLSVLEMSSTATLGVFEAGISRVGEMERIEPILQPAIGIFTNIGEAHAEGFASQLDKARSKALLFRGADTVVCSYDHKVVRSVLEELDGPKIVSWSIVNREASLFYRIQDHRLIAEFEGKAVALNLPFVNEPSLENLLHVITASLLLDVPIKQIQMAIQSLPTLDMRLSFKKGRNGCYLIDDTYNNDLVGLKIALESQEVQRTPLLSKTVILSDMQQTGLSKSVLYQRIRTLLEEQHVTRFIGIGFDEKIWRNETDFQNYSLFPSSEAFVSQTPSFQDELILVKGARSYALEKVVHTLQQQSHRTQLTISFEGLRHNLVAYKKLLRPTTRIMAMVKAFAYGGGAYEIASFLQHQGVDYLAVAYFDEGRYLREKGIEVPIMVMNPSPEALEDFDRFKLEPVIYHFDLLKHLIELSPIPGFHLEIETGMNRLGFPIDEIEKLKAQIDLLPSELLKSIFTHLAASEEPREMKFTKHQLSLFDAAYHTLTKDLAHRPIQHALNSSGIVNYPEYQYDMVRLGIGLYGVDPTEKLALQTIGNFSTYISQIKSVPKGTSIGYGRKGVVSKDSRIATLPVGYADGYLRVFGNGKALVGVGDRMAPTIGNICMDMMMIDVTDCEAEEGQQVTLMGSKPDITELAQWADTIPYEILTGISHRVERVYSWL